MISSANKRLSTFKNSLALRGVRGSSELLGLDRVPQVIRVVSVLLELCLYILNRAKFKCLFEYDHDLEADRRRIKDSGIDTKLDLFINIPDDLPERRKSITIAGYVIPIDHVQYF